MNNRTEFYYENNFSLSYYDFDKFLFTKKPTIEKRFYCDKTCLYNVLFFSSHFPHSEL